MKRRVDEYDTLFLCPHTFKKSNSRGLVNKEKRRFFDRCFNDFEEKEIIVVCCCYGFEFCDIHKFEEQLYRTLQT